MLKKHRKITAVLLAAVMCTTCCVLCSAAPASAESGRCLFSTAWGSTISDLYSIIKAIALPAGCLSIAYGGFCFFGSSLYSDRDKERLWARGKQIIFLSAVTVACIYLLPEFVSLAYSTWESLRYTPGFANTGIVMHG